MHDLTMFVLDSVWHEQWQRVYFCLSFWEVGKRRALVPPAVGYVDLSLGPQPQEVCIFADATIYPGLTCSLTKRNKALHQSHFSIASFETILNSSDFYKVWMLLCSLDQGEASYHMPMSLSCLKSNYWRSNLVVLGILQNSYASLLKATSIVTPLFLWQVGKLLTSSNYQRHFLDVTKCRPWMCTVQCQSKEYNQVETHATFIGYLELGITTFKKNKDFGYWEFLWKTALNSFAMNMQLIQSAEGLEMWSNHVFLLKDPIFVHTKFGTFLFA